MKTVSSFLALFLFCGAQAHVNAQTAPACGNNSQGGTAPCPTCPAGNTQHAIHVYTGNERREIKDLEVWGSVGEEPLTWTRYYNSRFVNSTNHFGSNQTWRHGYEWEISVTSGSNGPASVSLYYPNGVYNRFTRVGTTNKFVSTPAVTDILFLTDANTFTLQRADGFQYIFKYVLVGSSMIWQPSYFLDSQQNVYTFTYDTKNRLVRVGDATGRYLKITWQQLSLTGVNDTALAVLSSTAPADGQWTTVTSTSNTSFRYLRYQGYDHTYSSVAEINFLGAGGTPLSGTPFGSGFDQVLDHDFSKAFDGDTSTYSVSSVPTRDYVGFDLGTAASVGSIQFFPRSGHAADMARGRFIGSNTQPSTINVITKVDSSDGRSVTYDYASFNDAGMPQNWQTLVAAHYGDGTSATYTYVQPYPLTRPLVSMATDPRVVGAATTLQWQHDNTQSNVVGFVIKEMNGATGETMLTIDSPDGYDTVVTYANGGSTIIGTGHQTSLVNSTSDSLNRQTAYTYDQNGYGFLTSSTDSLNRTTSYTRTVYGNLLSITYPDNSTESWTRDDLDLVLTHTDGLGRVTTITRDTQHRVTRIDYPNSSFETFAYNSLGEVTSHHLRNGGTESSVYDARGLKASYTDALGNVTACTYDANDRLATVTDALNHTTSYAYNERGLVTAVNHADGSFTTYGYDAYGNRTSITNELGNMWTSVYDEFKRLKLSTDPLNRTTSYSYELPGGVCGCTHSNALPTSITLPSGKKTTYAYDSEWQKTGETVGFGTADAATTSYVYNTVGNVTSMTDPRGKIWLRAYNNRDWVASITDPLSHATQYSYDVVGNKLTETRPDNGVTTNAYDVMNRLTSTTDPKSETTAFAYDNADNLLTLTDARSNVSSYTYDLLNRKLTKRYPDASTEQWSYDIVGNPATYTTRAGQVCTYTHDNRNRNTLYTWSDGTPGSTKTYDAANRLLTNTNGVSALSYAYDIANQLLGETSDLSAINSQLSTKTVSYTYDVDGNRSSLTQPAGNVITYAYTGRNQVATINLDGPPPLASYSYDLNGNRLGKALENSTSTAYTYDDANRLTNLAHTFTGNSASFAYTYNSVDARTSRVETSGTSVTVTDTYGYDAIDQVTGVGYGSGRNVSYSYDPLGNRTSMTDSGTPTAYTANSLNQYTAVGGLSALAYDGNGNLTGYTGWSYSYDAQNRLISVSGGPSSLMATFAYDARNRCVSRMINGTATYFTYDGWSLIEDRDATDTQLACYIHGATIDESLAMIVSSGVHFYHQDALGSTVRITNTSGQVEESYTYDVFGAVTIKDGSGNPLTSSAVGNRFLFTGREWVKDVGLYDYRNRMYSSDLGRWLSRDPIGENGGINLYGYVGNGPINAIDPLGLSEVPPNLVMTSAQAQLARNAFGPGGTGQVLNPSLLNQASLQTLGVFQHNAQRGLALANSAGTAATQQCRLDAVNSEYARRAAALGVGGGAGAAAVGAAATATAIGTAPVGTATAILGVGTVGGLAVASGGVGYAIGTGIANIPTGGGNNVSSSLGGAIYNAAPNFWNGVFN